MRSARKKTIDFRSQNMKKKIFGIKIGTILSVFLCFIFAVLFWLFVKYSEAGESALLGLLPFYFGG